MTKERMNDRLVSTDAVMQSICEEYNRRFLAGDRGGLKLAWIEKAVNDTPTFSAPSAQSEIIRCKDCKYSEHWYRDKQRCFLWSENGIDVYDDGFCNYAERK